MTLEEYDVKVRPHLNFIRSGAEMAARHARQLPLRPAFESKAQDELAEARTVLEAALKQIVTAQETYASKPLETV